MLALNLHCFYYHCYLLMQTLSLIGFACSRLTRHCSATITRFSFVKVHSALCHKSWQAGRECSQHIYWMHQKTDLTPSSLTSQQVQIYKSSDYHRRLSSIPLYVPATLFKNFKASAPLMGCAKCCSHIGDSAQRFGHQSWLSRVYSPRHHNDRCPYGG